MAVKIIVIKGPEKGKTFSFDKADRFLVGRAKKAHLRFSEKDLYISRNHFLLEISSEHCYIKDLNSKNGTFVNGKRITHAELKNGDIIQIGDTILKIIIHAEKLKDIKPVTHSGEDYILLERIGKGGMAEVYKAHKVSTGEIVAFKWLRSTMNKDSFRLFEREISVMKKLNHPNLVRLIDYGEKDKRPFLITEYLAGGDVGRLIFNRRGPLSLKEACNIIYDILDGLEYAHNKGFVHRDIKVENILLDDKARAKLSDFGFAKSYIEAGHSMFTKFGELGGTFVYMAPEQISNYRFVKPSADIYSLGVCLYYMLTGYFPYPVPSPLQIAKGEIWNVSDDKLINFILYKEPIPIKEIKSEIPDEMAEVIHTALSKDIERRYKTAGEMKEAIRNILLLESGTEDSSI